MDTAANNPLNGLSVKDVGDGIGNFFGPILGTTVKKTETPSNTKNVMIAGIIFAVLVIGAILYYNSSKSTPVAQAA